MAATLRLCTINFWGIEPPLERRLELARRQLLDLAPDVVGMQEVRPLDGRSGRTTADVLAEGLGMQRVHEVAVSWADGAFGEGQPGGQEGLALLSRFPILEHRATPLPEPRPTEARILLSARLETPAGPIWCHTTHLHYRLDDGLAREKQVLAIDDVVRSLGRGAGDPPQLLCGDFNAPPDADEIRFLRGLCTLGGRRTHFQDAWLRARPDHPGITWSSENEQTRPLRSLDIDRRIDYVFVTTRRKDGRGSVIDARVVLDERDDGGACASDHFGVLAEVQIAPAGAG
ncbi:MAG TPA: endonuclease/exonuclease/phosphatase family protein [Kofleriaceae bacterium]|nr:endonuclease/exonuclease/phosphatase family protein [Kofleriaceae bacterium]